MHPFFILISLLALMNAFVSFAILRSPGTGPKHRLYLVFLVWLLPLIGAIYAWHLLLKHGRHHFISEEDGNEYVDLYFNYNTLTPNREHHGSEPKAHLENRVDSEIGC